MKARDQITADFKIELSYELGDLGTRLAAPPGRRAFHQALLDLMDEIRLPISPRVEVHKGTLSRPILVRINGTPLPYSPEVASQLWVCTVAPEHKGAVIREVSSTGFPGTWLSAWVQQQSATGSPAWSEAMQFVVRLVGEVARRNAWSLITKDVTREYLRNMPAGKASTQDLDALTQVLQGLVQAALSLANRAKLAAILDETAYSWISPLERSELLIELMHPHYVQVRGRAAMLAQLAPRDNSNGAPSPADVYPEQYGLAVAMYDELGVRVPPVHFVPDETVRERQIVIRVGHTDSVPYVLPPPGTVMVRELPTKLVQTHKVTAIAGLQPWTADVVGFVAEAEADRLSNEGLQVLTQAEWLMTAVRAEVLRRPHSILQLRHVLIELGMSGNLFPEVVRTALSLCAPTEIANLLRALIREGVSIRDLRAILDAMSSHVARSSDSGGALGTVRLRINEQVTYQAGHNTGRFFYFRLEPDLVTPALKAWDRLSTGHGDRDDEQNIVDLRDAVWTAVRRFHPASPPTMVTADDARFAVRSMLEPEMPRVPVLSESEIADFKEATEVATVKKPAATTA